MVIELIPDFLIGLLDFLDVALPLRWFHCCGMSLSKFRHAEVQVLTAFHMVRYLSPLVLYFVLVC